MASESSWSNLKIPTLHAASSFKGYICCNVGILQNNNASYSVQLRVHFIPHPRMNWPDRRRKVLRIDLGHQLLQRQ